MDAQQPRRHRLRRTLTVLAVAAALLLVALRLGEAWFVRHRLMDLVSRRPERLIVTADSIEVSGIATAHARGLRVRGQNRKCQWEVRVEEATANIGALALARKQLAFSDVDAKGTTVRISFWPAEDAGTGSAFAPPIEGLAQPPLAGSARPAPRPKKARPWTTRFEDARAELREVWIAGVKFEGAAVVGCDRVVVQPRRILDIDGATFVSTSGTLTLDGQPAAQDIALDALVDILGHDPAKERPAEMLRHVGGRVKGTASLKDCRLERIRVKALEWVRFGGGEGKLALDMALDHGLFETGSRFDLQADTLSLNALGRIVTGKALATFAVAGADGNRQGRLDMAFDDYHARMDGADASTTRFQGTGLRASLEFPEPGLLGPLRDYTVEATMPDTRFPDVTFLNELIPRETDVRVDSGALFISGEFRGTRDGGGGRVRLRGEDLGGRYKSEAFGGTLDLDAPMKLADFAGRRFEFPGTVLTLKGDMPAGKSGKKPHAAPWNGTIRFEQARLDLDGPVRFDTQVQAHLDDMRPAWRIADALLGLPDILKPLVAAKNVDVRAGVLGGPQIFELRDFALDGKGLKAKACVAKRDGRTAYVAWFDTGLAQGGARMKDGERHVKPFAGPKWYDEFAAECGTR